MIVVITGTRRAVYSRHARRVRSILRWVGGKWPAEVPHVLHHGAAVGIDRIGATVAQEMGWQVRPHPADWDLGRHAGHERNQLMIDLGPDVCVAFPLKPVDPGRSGTMDCTRRAIAAGVPTFVFPVDV